MAQLPAAHAPFGDNDHSDTAAPRDADTLEETLPSAADSSGLPPAVRQQLDAQVQAAGGVVDPLVQDLRARIATIDSSPLTADGTFPQPLQAERALYVSQISYLEDHVAGYRVEASDPVREPAAAYVTEHPAPEMSGDAGLRRARRARVYPTTST